MSDDLTDDACDRLTAKVVEKLAAKNSYTPEAVGAMAAAESAVLRRSLIRSAYMLGQMVGAAELDRLRAQVAALQAERDALPAPGLRPLREGEVMGAYMEFDRTADRSWNSPDYLVWFGLHVSRCTVQANSEGGPQPVAKADTRKPCTCDGAGRGPGRACAVKAGGVLGKLWRCAQGHEPQTAPHQQAESIVAIDAARAQGGSDADPS